METQPELLQEKLNSFLTQLYSEYGILDRLVYKNKNQHRRCSYFQYLLKVRRDLRLLRAVKLEEILGSCFLIITGKKPAQKVHLLESLKKRKSDGGKHNFMERLLGAAHLLSEMVEPMLKAATEISTLLARSFFMGFSLTILAVLARLRVLVQQMLLDIVSVFNQVSSLSQKPQSVKIVQEGIEVFREYFPKSREIITLECLWKVDKFVLVERTQSNESTSKDRDLGLDTSLRSSVLYQSIEAFLQDDEPNSKKIDASHTTKERPEEMSDAAAGFNFESNNLKLDEGHMNADNDLTLGGSPSSNFPALTACSELSKASTPSKRKADSRRKVAFVSVKRPATSAADVNASHLLKTKDDGSGNKEDPFFDFLTGGDIKGSLF